MSRCFPYPLPYFGQAENQSIKLLKEERAKKHTKKAKKERHAKDKAGNSNHEEKQHKKRKHKDKSEDDKRSHKKRKSEIEQRPLVRDLCSQKTSEAIEHLEKSGLTEELEPSCSIQHKLDSPESSQDSSKRRKLVLSSSSHDLQGTTLCIKLPILRQRVAEPSPLPLSRQTELQPPLPLSGQVKLALLSSRQIKPQPLSSSSSGKVRLPLLASSKQIKPQPSLPQSRLGGLTVPSQKQINLETLVPSSEQAQPAVPSSRQTRPPLPQSQLEELTMPLQKQINLQTPLPSSNQVQPALPSSRQTRELPPLPPQLGRLKRAVPSSKQTKLQLSLPPSGQVVPSLPLMKHSELQEQLPLPSLSNQIRPQPKNVHPAKQKLDQMPTAVAEQPCSSSRPPEAALPGAAAATTKTSRPNRVGGRTWQKEQYKTLVVNWNPPHPMQLDPSVVVSEDDDWLNVAPKQQLNPLKKDSTTTDSAGLICENHEVPLVQPRARCMPGLNLYLLPYAVPF
ncbi:nuclear pore complex-interacting protein family member B3-like [Zingiber officinale]|uniref:Uncharacterized protein n=1 Tax=Zingiber officinale TaxID=94328 RepID=A0A8J5GMZ2_ZINOF|nr:nuclear pore complex-interacting protein family member B3-like [Zingiber officinale]KAG6507250.1 hypothetical protein ZIOFF_032592 [Zingiber officinale]